MREVLGLRGVLLTEREVEVSEVTCVIELPRSCDFIESATCI